MKRALISLLLVLMMVSPAWAKKAIPVDDMSAMELLQSLEHRDWRVRLDATEELGKRNVLEAEGPFIRLATEDSEPRIRKLVVKMLVRMRSAKALPVGEALVLQDPDVGVRKESLAAIERYGSARSGPIVGAVAAEDPDSGIRRKALKILGGKGWTTANDRVVEALDDPDEKVRREAVSTLVRVAGPAERPHLHQLLLKASDEDTRYDVVRALEENPTAEDFDALIKALDDSHEGTARHAARALTKLGDRRAGPILREKSLQTKDEKVAEDFAEAAARLGS
jgi:HEAT repeat protein